MYSFDFFSCEQPSAIHPIGPETIPPITELSAVPDAAPTTVPI